jgi:hypothetical protein
MLQGMNLTWNTTWSGGVMFANVCYQMREFSQFSGSGSFTQDQGVLNASVSTDVFRAYISDTGLGMPAGTYTVYNPSGAEIAFGDFSNPTAYSGAYSTATTFTFTYPASGFLGLFVKGSLANGAGNLAVIIPGATSSWLGGNIWNPDYLAFHALLKARPLRMMDWDNASSSVETDWADRTLANKISLTNKYGKSMPVEFKVDFANRVDSDPWICIPTRATSDYVTQLATYVKANLNPNLKPWFEHGNEIWNYGTPWADGTRWVEYLDFTRYTATANFGANTYTLSAHGLTQNQVINSFITKENRAAGVTLTTQLLYGNSAFIDVVDANTFRLLATSGGTVIPVVSGQVNILFCKAVESGKTTATNASYGNLCIRNWDILDPIMGVDSYNRLVVRQVNSTSTLSQALAVSGVSSRATHISGAPYFYGEWWGGAIDISTGQFLPKVWTNGSSTFHVAVYASGATPTEKEILAGTGAINKQSFTSTYSGSSWTSGVAVTGLTNGTSYKVYFVLENTDRNYLTSKTIAASASASTEYFYDSYANQAFRNRKNVKQYSILNTKAFMTAGGAIPFVAYEGGLHFHESAPSQISTWLVGSYQESDEYAATMDDYLRRLAAIGTKAHCWYAEVLSTSFSIANTFTDTSDKRFLKLASYSGAVPKGDELLIADITATPVLTAPGLPYVIQPLPSEVGRTYALADKNLDANYDVSGNNLRLIATNNLNFSQPTLTDVYLEAYRGSVSDQFKTTFFIGDAWYSPDAKFAWSPVTDTDTAAANPTVGGAVARTTGVGAVAASGLWDMDENIYTTTTGLTSTVSTQTPFLYAAVIDKDNHTNTFTFVCRNGNGSANWLSFYFNGANFINMNSNINGANLSLSILAMASMSGKNVYWVHSDGGATPTFTVGYNQITATSAVHPGVGTGLFDRHVTLGETNVKVKLGSVQFSATAGMTLSNALALVAKMQAHHSIP